MKFYFVVKDTTGFNYNDSFNEKLRDVILIDCEYKIVNDYIEIDDLYIEGRCEFSVNRLDKTYILFLDDRNFVCSNYNGDQKCIGDIVCSVSEWVIKGIIE
jgi:hypothetical protein